MSIETSDDDLTKAPYLRVDEIIVKKGLRRQGIGKSLMEMVHKYAKGLKLQLVQLAVWEVNKEAIRFFSTIGLQAINAEVRKNFMTKSSKSKYG